MLQQLDHFEAVFTFLNDMGAHFKPLMKVLQTTKQPIAHILYPTLLKFQQAMFNTALRLDDGVPESDSGVLGAPDQPADEAPEQVTARAPPTYATTAATVFHTARHSQVPESAPESAYSCICEDKDQDWVECDFKEECVGAVWYHASCAGVEISDEEEMSPSCASLARACRNLCPPTCWR